VAARITDRLSLVTGSAQMAAGYVNVLATHASAPDFHLGTAHAGIGNGFPHHATSTHAVESVPHDLTSVGSGIVELLLKDGCSRGAAADVTVVAGHTPAGHT
ncbi:hypothetical protein PUR59_02855, partial [Streptomyces sp. SP18ES09]|nr:hypothetical protein [Streptomyces sp. SP18ES09]